MLKYLDFEALSLTELNIGIRGWVTFKYLDRTNDFDFVKTAKFPLSSTDFFELRNSM